MGIPNDKTRNIISYSMDDITVIGNKDKTQVPYIYSLF